MGTFESQNSRESYNHFHDGVSAGVLYPCIDRRCLALPPQPQPQGGALASPGSASSVRQTWRCRTTMVQHPHHLKSALLCTWMTLGDGGSYLGIGSDAHGLYRTPPPALRTLRSDFHFARDHSLAVGEPPLLLSEISAFGGSMHLQLDVMGSNASTFALELSVLGGASTVSVEHIAPPRDQCTGAKNLVNNSIAQYRSWRAMDTPVSWASWSMPPPFSTGLALVTGSNTSTPQWCRDMCCANRECSGWTYTDPQFSQPSANMCWLYQGVAEVVPGGPNCDGTHGHCWAGLGNAGQGRWTVNVDGKRFVDPSFFRQNEAALCSRGSAVGASQCRVVPTAPSAVVGALAYTQIPTLDVFVDGTAVEVFFNGMVRRTVLRPAEVNGTGVSLAIKAGASLVTVHAWRMSGSSGYY